MPMGKPILVVRGIGSDRTLAFSVGPSQVDDSEFDLVPAASRMPKNISTSTNWLSGEMSVDGCTWTLSASALVSEVFLRRVVRADGFITETVADDASQVTISPADNFEAGDIIHINGEAILLVSVVSQDGDAVTYSVTRGMFQTRQTEHIKAKNVNDRVYMLPRMRGRECFMMWEHETFDYDRDVFWIGIIDDIDDAEDMASVQISLRDVIGLNVRKFLNDPPYSYRNDGDILAFREDRGVRASDHSPYGSGQFVDRNPVPARGELSGDNLRVSLQHDDTIYLMRPRSLSDPGNERLGYDPVLGNRHPLRPPIPLESGQSEHNVAEDDRYDGVHHAVFCYGYLMEQLVDDDVYYWGNLPWYAPGEEPVGVPHTNYHHPGHALLVGLLSGTRWVNHPFYDHAGRRWGLGIPSEYVDIEGIESWINATPDLRVRSKVWGFDGASWSGWDWVKAHTIIWRMYPGLDQKGRLTVYPREFVSDADIVVAYRRVHELSEGQGQKLFSAKTSVEGSQGLPWQSTPPVLANDRSEGDDLWRYQGSRRAGITVPGSEMTPPPNVQGEGGVAYFLEDMLQWARFDIPEIRLTVDHDETIPPGASIEIDESDAPAGYQGVWWEKNGTRQFDEIKGIVSSSRKIWSDGSHELTVDLVNDPVIALKLVAPSARATNIELISGDPDVYRIRIPAELLGVDLQNIELGDVDGIRMRTWEGQGDADLVSFSLDGSDYVIDLDSVGGAFLDPYISNPSLVTVGITPTVSLAEQRYIQLFDTVPTDDSRPYYV